MRFNRRVNGAATASTSLSDLNGYSGSTAACISDSSSDIGGVFFSVSGSGMRNVTMVPRDSLDRGLD